MIEELVKEVSENEKKFDEFFYKKYQIFSENYENLVSKGVVKKREFSLDIGLDSFDLVFNAKKCF